MDKIDREDGPSVTTDMIDAGMHAYFTTNMLVCDVEFLVTQIFLAMEAVNRSEADKVSVCSQEASIRDMREKSD